MDVNRDEEAVKVTQPTAASSSREADPSIENGVLPNPPGTNGDGRSIVDIKTGELVWEPENVRRICCSRTFAILSCCSLLVSFGRRVISSDVEV